MNMVAAATVVSLSIARVGTQPSQKGPAEYFTGSVRIDPLFQAKESTRASGAYVTFEPGARSAWHTHPLGQTLIVTADAPWVRCFDLLPPPMMRSNGRLFPCSQRSRRSRFLWSRGSSTQQFQRAQA